MQAEKRPAAASRASRTARPRRWRWMVLITVLGLLVLLAALPYLASIGPIRDLLLRAVLPKINGSVHAGAARLGWFSPICFEQIEIRSTDGEPVVSIPRLQGNRELWRMVLGSNLGEFRIQQPRLDVVLERGGTNLSRVFAGRKPDEKTITKPPNVALGVRLVDGSVSVRSYDSVQPWTAEPINFAFKLKPASASTDPGAPRLEIEPGVVFSHTQVTPEVCHDLLKYIAPILADVAETSGSFSIDLDRWELPLTDLARGSGAGRLTIHELAVGPGALVRELATALRMPPRLVTVENEPITFRLSDGRIHHSELTFRLQRLVIRTSGSVGLDGSLSMVAEVPMPAHLLGDRPIAAILAKQTLRIPIKGTLKKPRIDGQGLLKSLGDSGFNILDGVRKDDRVDLGELLKAIRPRPKQQPKRPGPSDKQPKRPLGNLIRGALDEALKDADEKKPDDKQ